MFLLLERKRKGARIKTTWELTPGIYFIRKEIIMLFTPIERGQGLVEYSIILALVAIVVIAVMRLLGPKVGNSFSSINNSMNTL